jgi:hypothetical protein
LPSCRCHSTAPLLRGGPPHPAHPKAPLDVSMSSSNQRSSGLLQRQAAQETPTSPCLHPLPPRRPHGERGSRVSAGVERRRERRCRSLTGRPRQT